MTNTITFSEYANYTVNPTFTFADNTVTTVGEIVDDGAQPNSPVIAANSSYTGPVFIYFQNAVKTVSLDVGYFDNIGSTRIEFRDQQGNLIQAFHNGGLGVLPFSLSYDAGIKSISVVDEAFDAAGFSVDTVVFGDAAAALIAPTVSRVSAATGTIDRAFGTVQGDTVLRFADGVGGADAQDFLTLTVGADTTAQVKIYLNSDPQHAREFTLNLTAGANTLQIAPDTPYDSLQNYTVLVKVTDYVSPEDEFINEMFANIVGTLFDYKKTQSEIFAYITKNMKNPDDAARFLGKMGKAFSILGLTIDLTNRIDNVYAAGNWKRQLAIETGDFLTGLALTGGVGAGVTFVGTPIAGALAGFVTGGVYTYGLSNYVKNEIGNAYDAYLAPQGLSLFAALANDTPNFSNLIFDEQWYLATYPDAAAAVASGDAVSGLAYYLAHGMALGEAINSGGTVVPVSDLATGFAIGDPANLPVPNLSALALGALGGDLVSTGERQFVAFLNGAERTAGTELALNAALSALANRVAQDWVKNQKDTIDFASTESATWAETLSTGANYKDYFATIATNAGVDLSAVTLLASWQAGETPIDVFGSLSGSISASSALLGLASESIGVAQVGGLWIALVSTQALADNATAVDLSVSHLFGTDDADSILGSASADRIDAGPGDDIVEGRGGNDRISGGDGRDLLEGGAGADTLFGGAGDDHLSAGAAAATEAYDFTVGGTGVQTVGADVVNDLASPLPLADQWSLAQDDNIANSTTDPHLSVRITGSGQNYEAFSFHALAGRTYVFDVDGATRGGSNVDTYLELYNSSGTLLASDDDSSTTDGAGGSTSGYDPYLTYTFTSDGDYTIALRNYSASTPIDTTEVATIDISVQGANYASVGGPEVDNLDGGDGNDLLIGGAGDDTLVGGAGVDTTVYAFARTDATLTRNADGSVTIASAAGGTDTLTTIERVRFLDRVVPLVTLGASDFDGSLTSDVLLRNAAGVTYLWSMNGPTVSAGNTTSVQVGNAWQIEGVADFDGDGRSDLLWVYDNPSDPSDPLDGVSYVSFQNGPSATDGGVVQQLPSDWALVGVGDFTADGKADVLYRNTTTGRTYLDVMSGNAIDWTSSGFTTASVADPRWTVAAVADFDGDGDADVLWRYADASNPADPLNGTLYEWQMDGTTVVSAGLLSQQASGNWQVEGTGDFDGDGKADILFRYHDAANASDPLTGITYIASMNGTTVASGAPTGWQVDETWQVASIGDFDGNGKADILWQQAASGDTFVWTMRGTDVMSGAFTSAQAGPGWTVQNGILVG